MSEFIRGVSGGFPAGLLPVSLACCRKCPEPVFAVLTTDVMVNDKISGYSGEFFFINFPLYV
jgi:hypothetical protein